MFPALHPGAAGTAHERAEQQLAKREKDLGAMIGYHNISMDVNELLG
jgi:hypothetical protein